jgi:K+-transporting ATPase ATPase A chain
VGAGLYGMLIFVVLAVFIAGLMVGRTPEYLGKKIESYDVKLVMIVLMVLSATVLAGTAWACITDWGQAGLNNSGPHGFSEILYLYSSSVGNNGSAFAGLTGNPSNGDWHYNVTGAIAMLFGRFLMIVPILALAGNLASKKLIPVSAGTFRTEGVTFVVLLIGTVVLVGALTFLPALAVGPIVEHYLMGAGTLF